MRSSTHSRFSLTCKKLNSLKQLSSVAVIMLKDFFHINGFNICRQSRVEKKKSWSYGIHFYGFQSKENQASFSLIKKFKVLKIHAV